MTLRSVLMVRKAIFSKYMFNRLTSVFHYASVVILFRLYGKIGVFNVNP